MCESHLSLLRLAEVGKQVLKPIMKMLPAHSPAGGKECSRQLGRSESEQWTVIQLPSSLPSTPTTSNTIGPAGSTTIGPSSPTNTTIGFSNTTIGPANTTIGPANTTIAEEKPEHVISMPVSFTELPTPVGGFHRKLRLMRSNSDPDVMLAKRPPPEEAKSELVSVSSAAAEHQLTFELRSIEDSGGSMNRSLSHNDLILDDSCKEQQQDDEPSEASLDTAAHKMEEVISQSKSKRPLFSMFKNSRRKRVSSVTSSSRADDSTDPRRRRKFLGRTRSLGPKKIKENRQKSNSSRSGTQSASNSIDQEEELPTSSSNSSCEQQRPVLEHADR